MREAIIKLFNLDHNDVKKLLEIVLANNYFTFDDVTYQQINGLAMEAASHLF